MVHDRHHSWRGNSRGRSGRSGVRGGGPRRRGDGGTSRGPCFHFQRGSCTFGAACHFSHDISTVPYEERLVQDQYYAWKRLLGFESYRRAYKRIWHDALEILDGEDREVQQLLARDLVDEGNRGFEVVRDTLDVDQQTGEAQLSIATAFLRVITHTALLDCLSIEPFVGTLYTFIGGSGGGRGIAYFSRLCLLLELPEANNGLGSDPEKTFHLMLRALHELLSREQRALYNQMLPPLFDSLDQAVEKLHLDETRGARIEAMRRMLKSATRLVAAAPQHAANARGAMMPKFPLQIEIPGGRHDNDFLDASQIGTLPTVGEITADMSEYLPTTNFLQPHFSSSNQNRYLDTAIRLLRHDLFGPLKEDLCRMLSDLAEGVHPSKLLRDTQTRAYVYTQAEVSHLLVDRRRGIEALITFAPPTHIRGKKKQKELSRRDQAQWWRDSPRFAEGALACFVAADQDGRSKEVLFLVVTEKNAEVAKGGKSSHLVPEGHKLPSIAARLATRNEHNLQALVCLHGDGVRGVLVDLPGLIPATFTSVIENLQKMLRRGELAFCRWLVPPDVATAGSNAGGSAPTLAGMPPPEYARRPGFVFRLDAIAQNGAGLFVDPMAPQLADLGLMEDNTGLDRGQCEGLVAALTREYALIQGPPGTGKSFLGVKLLRVLLAHKCSQNLGPILVICYTNHALDQFLKHLLDVGVEKLIRIGGQSRMPELDGLNLRVVGREQVKTRVEYQQLGKAYAGLEECMESSGRSLGPLHRAQNARPSWAVLDHFLRHEHPGIHKQFLRVDEEGFEQVGKSPFDLWLGHGPHRSGGANTAVVEPDLDLETLTTQAERDVQSLLPIQRQSLASSWMSSMRREQAGHLFHASSRAKDRQQAIDEVHSEVHRRVLLGADVIGVTTTGLARHMSMLQRVRSKVVVCEEAGEVMEPHMAASALLPGVEHLIQIGDHCQLRPQIANFGLSIESNLGQPYQLDRSQFERRAEGEPGMAPAPVAQLNVQRRMRPEISALIRDIYPRLEDHQTVRDYPNIVGMSDNIFWLDHEHLEDGVNEESHNTRSHSNEWEVAMTRALVRHLVLQGTYRADDIAVLTPYTGQLQKLRAALGRDFELFLSERDEDALAADGFEDGEADSETPEDKNADNRKAQEGHSKPLQKKTLAESLRLATVDNFQGEEAKAVVVSLVRANPQRRVGFLRTENRINVLVSRAQHGLFLLGNAATYLNVPMWARIHTQLAEAGGVGTALRLACPRHPDSPPMVCATPDDFVRCSPEGGCARQCDRRLDRCGHRCQAKCHAPALHDAFLCPKACPRIRKTCAHACSKLCGEDCGRCPVRLDGIVLPCSHVHDSVACHQTQNLQSVVCRVKVDKMVPGCGHEVMVECHKDVASASFRCSVRCGGLLECGHACPGTCGSCRSEADDGSVTFAHQGCQKPCQRPYRTCNHHCPKVCHKGQECGSCQQPCQVRCPHSACSLCCSEPCAPCIERCTWSCVHQGSCSMPCAAPCDRLPCDRRCDRDLTCGHRCPGLCGEECPEGYCSVCGDDNKQNMRVDLLEMKTLAEIDLNDTPIVVLGCGHAFTAESLDGAVGMGDVYAVDAAGQFTRLLGTTFGGGPMAAAVPACPDCMCPVRQFATRRYNRVVNRAVMDETSRRFLLTGLAEIAALELRLSAIEEALKETATGLGKVNTLLCGDVLRTRYKEIIRLERDSRELQKQVDNANQPAQRLFDAIVSRRNQIAALELGITRLAVSPNESERRIGHTTIFDKQVPLGAELVQLKAQCILLQDKFRVNREATRRAVDAPRMPHGKPGLLAPVFLEQCEAFVLEAREYSLPRLFLQASLCHARIATLAGSDFLRPLDERTVHYRDMAKALLGDGIAMCAPLTDMEDLRGTAEVMLGFFRATRYETVVPEEIAAVKLAMVSGPRGINTNSGHWYNCENGHPFAIGECGMPMEEARCPECGSRIGGQHHTLVDGVSRATEMER